jgi:valyl-tRNA synthetase
MEKVYSPGSIERRLYEHWEANGWFAPSGRGAPFCIVIPPPNVTGTLHMGHAFQHTLMDALIRWHRMRGDDTLWQTGTDHAGIATQMVVERQLNAAGTRRTELTRDAFVERVWAWKAESGNTISRQMRRLGDSVDWSRERFTMDPELSSAVTEVFVRLFEEGLLYRGKRLVNWDPVLLTAISDLEVLGEEEDGFLWHLRYPLAEGGAQLVVATTRPETLLGDTAVAVHPGDERYAHLIGRRLRVPLTERLIPVIADDYVDPAFGSGCVKITPAHDFNDYEVGLRHGLEVINIFTPSAALNERVPPEFRGLDRFEARARVVAALEAQGLLERVDKHRLVVPRGDRSGAVIEPYLTDQWYVRVEPLALPAIRAVEDGSIRFVPDNWSKTYFEWMRHIKDWCVSRQLWWGHRIPAWYDAAGAVYVGRSEEEVRARHRLGEGIPLRRDEDVLDTWFSSALWPFSTQGWPERTPALAKFYPSQVLVTGFDIIFFWVARMIMMGLKFMGSVPFRDVYIHGLILDEHGEKMSKTKGNIIDPLDIVDGIELDALVRKRTAGLMQPHLASGIEKATRRQFPDGISAYGTDALRFTFASLAGASRDLRFDLGRVGGYRNFCNKLWNAARFVIGVTDDAGGDRSDAEHGAELELSAPDLWIRARLGSALRAFDGALAEYRFDFAATALYEFTWYEFCDWYLELAKPVLQSESSSTAQRHATRATLITVLETLLRALHPLMPFITEEIWQRVAPRARELSSRPATKAQPAAAAPPTIMLAPWPRADDFAAAPEAERSIAWLRTFVMGVRQIRSEMDLPPSTRLSVLLQNAAPADLAQLAQQTPWLERLAGLASVRALRTDEAAPESATALVGDMLVLVPLAGLIDPAAECDRLARRIAKAQAELAKLRGKLANENFVRHAPPEVVAGDRAREAELAGTLTSFKGQLARVRRLLP